MDDLELLSFAALNRRIELAPDVSTNRVRAPRTAKLSLIAAMGAGAVALACQWAPVSDVTKVVLMGTLLLIEIVGITIHICLTWSDTFSRTPIRDFAEEMDHGYPHYFEILGWLRAQPGDLLRRHAEVATYRCERLTQRFPLFFGGVQSLGVLPVVIAVYLQVREVLAGRHIGAPETVLAGAVVGLYYATWVAALAKSRLESMNALLSAALNADPEPSPTLTPNA